MSTELNKSYIKTPNKVRILWNLAHKLIGEYEDFDRRLVSLEEKFKSLAYNISSTIDRINNV